MSEAAYYERPVRTYIDGTPIFKSQEDERNEDSVARVLERLWGCQIGSFGKLAPIDFYEIREGRLTGILELKCRSHPTTKYETVFLNVRKWINLTIASNGLGVPAMFVVRFTDSLRSIPVAAIDATGARMGGVGQARAMKTRTEREPVIDVPVADMEELGTFK